jgi:hypothetical protein
MLRGVQPHSPTAFFFSSIETLFNFLITDQQFPTLAVFLCGRGSTLPEVHGESHDPVSPPWSFVIS